MFGAAADYWLLKPLTHARNRATAEELARRIGTVGPSLDAAPGNPPYTLAHARDYVSKAADLYFGGTLPIASDLSYLDLGCGTGRLAIGLSLLGAQDVTGVDLLELEIATANAVAATLPPELRRPRFVQADGRSIDGKRYDVVVALAAMEHVSAPREFLEKIYSLLKPEGRAFVSMTPFHGPMGDHLWPFFRVAIPWRGVLFSEKALLRLRRERFRPSSSARRFEEVEGGLNLMTVGEYLRNIRLAGLDVVAHRFDPHFYRYRRLWPLALLSWVLTRIPGVRDYCTVNVYSVLRRAAPAGG